MRNYLFSILFVFTGYYMLATPWVSCSNDSSKTTKTWEELKNLRPFDGFIEIGDGYDNYLSFLYGKYDLENPTTNIVEGCNTGDAWYLEDPVFYQCTGIPKKIAIAVGTAEFIVLGYQPNLEYTFTTSFPTDFITITSRTGTNILASGTGSVTWTAPSSTNQIRIYIHANEDCGTDDNVRYVYAKCGETIQFPDPDFGCFQGNASQSGLFDGALLVPEVNLTFADDFMVEPNTHFDIKQILLGVFSGTTITHAKINIRKTNLETNLPGEIVGSVDLPSTSSLQFGTYMQENLPAWRVTFDLPTPIRISQGGKYWIEVVDIKNTSNTKIKWEFTPLDHVGSDVLFSMDDGENWNQYATGEDFIFDGHFYVAGDCSVNTDCNPLDVPFLQDFNQAEFGGMPLCTTLAGTMPLINWSTDPLGIPGMDGMVLKYSSIVLDDIPNWFFTQGINMKAGKEYQLSYKYGRLIGLLPQKLKVAFGTSPTNAGMTMVINNQPEIDNSEAETVVIPFTVPADGVYYFGFNGYQTDFGATLIDDIAVDYLMPENDNSNCSFTHLKISDNESTAAKFQNDRIGIIGENAEIASVSVNLEHTKANDLELTLISPSGSEVALSTDNGGPDGLAIPSTLVFTDDSTNSITSWTGGVPLTDYKAEGGLSTNPVADGNGPGVNMNDEFDGESIFGEWKLRAYDDTTGDIGYIHSFCIDFDTNGCANGLDYFDGLGEPMTPRCGGHRNVVVSGISAGYYTRLNLTGGEEFKFFTDIETDFLTITNEAGTLILGAGEGEIVYTPETDSIVRIYINSDNECGTDNVSRFLFSLCGEPIDLPEPTTDCYDGNASESNLSLYMFNDSFLPFSAADDFEVEEGTKFSIEQAIFSVVSFGEEPGQAVIKIRKDAGGIPGSVVYARTVSPISNDLYYEVNSFKYYRSTYKFAAPLVLEEPGKYWVEYRFTYSTPELKYGWEYCMVNYTGNQAAMSDNGGESWMPIPGDRADLLFYVAGECEDLSVTDMDDFSFEYYPNPVSDYLTIQSKKSIQKVSIMNFNGQLLKQESQITQGKVNMRNLPSGVYLVKVEMAGGQIETFKVIKK